MTIRPGRAVLTVLVAALLAVACGGDDDETDAQKHGIGSGCISNADCEEEGQTCLPFKGGYCGVADCDSDLDCPDGSACVAHDDGKNYCFLVCLEKPECNRNRSIDAEANCSSNITFVDGNRVEKACVPPSS